MEYNIHTREKNNSYQYIISYKDNLGKWKQKSKQGFKDEKTAKKEALKYIPTLEKDLSNSIVS